MTTPVLSTASASALSTLLALLKAEQAKLTEQTQTQAQTQAPATAKPQDLKSLGAQIVRSLEATQTDALTQLFGGASEDGAATDPLAALLGGNDRAATESDPSTSTSSSTLTDLAAQLAKTQAGPAGDAARAKILAKITTGGSTQASGSLIQGASLFSFLG